ncbi:unnamed protein product [Choristocarpus tenellus]
MSSRILDGNSVYRYPYTLLNYTEHVILLTARSSKLCLRCRSLEEDNLIHLLVLYWNAGVRLHGSGDQAKYSASVCSCLHPINIFTATVRIAVEEFNLDPVISENLTVKK